MSWRAHTNRVLQSGANAGTLSKWINLTIMILIIISVGALVMETIDELYQTAPGLFRAIEAVCVGAFTIEYVLRLWSCTANRKYHHPIRGRLRYAASPMMVIDLLAIVPFYLPMLGIDLRALRLLRLFRLLRIMKLARYTTALQSITAAIYNKRAELLVTLGFLMALLFISASFLHFAEQEAQPEHFGSIPESMWWSIVTLTTIGYGDVVPVTAVGRIAAAAVAIIGIGFVALPTGILGSAFVEEVARRKAAGRTCPTCGQPMPGHATAKEPDSPTNA